MMAIDNPILSLKNLNDLQDKVVNNTATVSDYEEIDFFISAIGGNKDYIKNNIVDNGFSDVEQYIKTKKENRNCLWNNSWCLGFSKIICHTK